MTTNQNHPDDHLAIEALHSRYLNVLTGRTSDHLLMFQDEAYALGRARGRLDVFRLDLHLERQRRLSERTFGPGSRAAGVIDHIRKELRELEEAPGDLAEWIDVVVLALDGAWRTGATPAQIIDALLAKQAISDRDCRVTCLGNRYGVWTRTSRKLMPGRKVGINLFSSQ
ncbi:dATP/dGTP pyrophosphohydrolase domain-containing protein [Pseudomonas aeruginosa]|uniref:dATP/dGTP pyrophosphohydrolase domain-containing protein n=1 Tax=Pseudomonas aeruginosa TaxID=287 RepID=UPI002359E187|nr:dATP/dGTP pyrophosphohydrolase domain-containing protein [Pseudomonas aeruginosa]